VKARTPCRYSRWWHALPFAVCILLTLDLDTTEGGPTHFLLNGFLLPLLALLGTAALFRRLFGRRDGRGHRAH
jgi:hypothetical protein